MAQADQRTRTILHEVRAMAASAMSCGQHGYAGVLLAAGDELDRLCAPRKTARRWLGGLGRAGMERSLGLLERSPARTLKTVASAPAMPVAAPARRRSF